MFDIGCAGLGLVCLSPLFLLVAIAVKASDGGPVFYRQQRVGRWGKLFWIYKFRTMVPEAEKLGVAVTKDQDPRITRVGRVLRKWKLDELPQLWNVLEGKMSFVGPRPEVPRYVAHYTPAQREILQHQPGITDLATLMFREEEELLRNADNVEEFYLAHCVPKKIALNEQYARKASLVRDLWIIMATLCPAWVAVLVLYSAVLCGSIWVALELRFDFAVPAKERSLVVPYYVAWIVPLQLALLLSHRHFRGVLSFFNLPEAVQIARCLAVAACGELVAWHAIGGASAPPRTLILMQPVGAFLMLCGARLGLRRMRLHTTANGHHPAERPRRVAIIGADGTGAGLALAIAGEANPKQVVVAFFDDDPALWHKRLHGILVAGMPENLLEGEWRGKIDEVVLAITEAAPARMLEITRMLTRARLKYVAVPSSGQLLSGRFRVGPAAPYRAEVVLKRPVARFDLGGLDTLLKDKVVLVAGAGGSLGRELGKRILQYAPARLVLVDRTESRLHASAQELAGLAGGGVVAPLVADLNDRSQMRRVFQEHQPQVVYHAAAYKNEGRLEHNAVEVIKNNVFAHACLAETAFEFGAGRFTMVSRAEALNPESVMGASRRLQEMILEALEDRVPFKTEFIIARTGCIIESTSSEVTVFQKQIEAGGPVKVADAQAARHLMLRAEAVELVLYASLHGKGGEVFAMDTGEPCKMVDLARQLIELNGYKPGADMPVEVDGRRAGEMLPDGGGGPRPGRHPAPAPRIVRTINRPVPWDILQKHLNKLQASLSDPELSRINYCLKKAVPEYRPLGEGTADVTTPVRGIQNYVLQGAAESGQRG